jgi:hypothetical protein
VIGLIEAWKTDRVGIMANTQRTGVANDRREAPSECPRARRNGHDPEVCDICVQRESREQWEAERWAELYHEGAVDGWRHL